MNWADMDDPRPGEFQFCTSSSCLKPLIGQTSRDPETGQVFFKCDCGMEYVPRYNPNTGKRDWLPKNH